MGVFKKRGGDFVVQIHKRSTCEVLTLAFAAQADTFASRQQKTQSVIAALNSVTGCRFNALECDDLFSVIHVEKRKQSADLPVNDERECLRCSIGQIKYER